MSPFDISGLQGLRDLSPEERVDYNKNYELGGEYQPPPPEGQYYLQTVKLTPAVTQTGALAADIMAVVADNNPQGAGYKVYENKKSIKKYSNRNGSPLGDYLLAHGIQLTGDPTKQDYQQAVGATENRFAPATLKWEGYCSSCDETVIKGQDSFPKREDGTRNYRATCPHCKKEVLARAKVDRWISTVAQQQQA